MAVKEPKEVVSLKNKKKPKVVITSASDLQLSQIIHGNLFLRLFNKFYTILNNSNFKLSLVI